MNSMPYAVFYLGAEVLDDHYDEPRDAANLEAEFRAWLKARKLKAKTVSVSVVEQGRK